MLFRDQGCTGSPRDRQTGQGTKEAGPGGAREGCGTRLLDGPFRIGLRTCHRLSNVKKNGENKTLLQLGCVRDWIRRCTHRGAVHGATPWTPSFLSALSRSDASFESSTSPTTIQG